MLISVLYKSLGSNSPIFSALWPLLITVTGLPRVSSGPSLHQLGFSSNTLSLDPSLICCPNLPSSKISPSYTWTFFTSLLSVKNSPKSGSSSPSIKGFPSSGRCTSSDVVCSKDSRADIFGSELWCGLFQAFTLLM